MSDDQPVSIAPVVRDWNADDRSRAETRGLLMALSRKRDWYFVQSIPFELIVGILTLGLRPVLTSARRFDRWRRLEWVQYAELARWLSARTGDPIAVELERFAAGAANGRGRRSSTWCFVLGCIVVMVLAIWTCGDWRIAPVIALVPAPLMPSPNATWTSFWAGWFNLAYAGLLSIAWLFAGFAMIQHQWLTSTWSARGNELLVAHEKRAVSIARSQLPWAWFALGIVLGIVGPAWMGTLVVVIAMQNRYIIATRAARLAFIERMLEWMDRSGLPVEFDVEEIAPDVAAALA